MSKLSPDGRRLRTIIITTPFVVASSILLYKRLFLGEEQRTLPRLPVGRAKEAAERAKAGAAAFVDGWDGLPEDVAQRLREEEARSKR
ncbi:hypothetical protein JCM8097_000115 [Rhodosporidiobolus ruineniae]